MSASGLERGRRARRGWGPGRSWMKAAPRRSIQIERDRRGPAGSAPAARRAGRRSPSRAAVTDVPAQAKSPFLSSAPPSSSVRVDAAVALDLARDLRRAGPSASSSGRRNRARRRACRSSSQCARTGGFGRNARSNFWTRPWTLVNVPSFSASEAAGQDDVGGARQGVRRAGGDRQEAGLAQHRDLRGVVGDRREVGVRDDDDLGRGLAGRGRRRGRSRPSRGEAHVRARRGSSPRPRRPRPTPSAT